jgi:hypothetical protein
MNVVNEGGTDDDRIGKRLRLYSGDYRPRYIYLGRSARLTDRVCRRDVVVPSWATIYNEAVGLPLTPYGAMLRNESPSTSSYRVEVESSGGKLGDGLAAATFNHENGVL